MAQVRVRKSGLSRTSSLLMILLGLVSFIFVSSWLGLALMAIGTAMYFVYARVTRQASAAV